MGEQQVFADEMQRLVTRQLVGISREQQWKAMQHNGLHALTVAEELGGQGAGAVEQAALADAFGSSLLAVPYLGTSCLAMSLLAALPTAPPLLQDVVDGSVTATLLFGLRSMPDLGDAVLDGADHVSASNLIGLDVDVADLLLVIARDPAGRLSLVRVDAHEPAVLLAPVKVVDTTRPVTRVTLAGAACTTVDAGPQVEDAFTQALRAAWLYLAAESLGAARQALATTISYVKERQTFGRAVGSYQSVKHRCTDRWLEATAAELLLHAALEGPAPEDGEHPDVLLHLAVAEALDLLHRVAGDGILLHGGMGFTHEHVAHRYWRRARSTSVVLGNAAGHRERAAPLLELTA